jgi:hypothetical protein
MPICLGSGRIIKPSRKVLLAEITSTVLEDVYHVKMSKEQRQLNHFWLGFNGSVQVHNRTVALMDAVCPEWTRPLH